MRRTLLLGLALAMTALAAPVAGQGTPASRGRSSTLSPSDVKEARRRLLSLLRGTDIGDSQTPYDAQQQGMALVDAVFAFGSDSDRREVVVAAASLVQELPTLESLLRSDLVAANLARLELLSRYLTRLRQRVGTIAVSVDNLPVPGGVVRQRRVFPMVVGDKINVLSEVELQYVYLLSTILREAALHPVARGGPEASDVQRAMQSLFQFLLEDKVRFYWLEMPAWHWSGPFANMRERVSVKLADRDPRVRRPMWFGAMIDHELHLFGVAADLRAALRADPSLAATLAPGDARMLDEIWRDTLLMLHTRVTSRDGQGFLIDYGRWTSNPSYAYAGCETRTPQPSAPCAIDSVATDASHARRWPWWLRSMRDALASGTPEATAIERYQRRLAHQLASVVLYTDSTGRPLLRNYMDGRDGWYRLKESPAHPSGNGPSSMSGAMRYGSWALLAPLEPRIAAAQRRFCAVLASTDPADIAFRTRFYGSPSTRPGMAGLGETDLYGAGSFYTLTCRIDAALGEY